MLYRGRGLENKPVLKQSYVYILKCADNSYYTGVTSNLKKRIAEHESGKYKDSYTHKRLPVELVYHAEFTDITKAIDYEKKIKKWSRAKKEALINGDLEKLTHLAKKKFK